MTSYSKATLPTSLTLVAHRLALLLLLAFLDVLPRNINGRIWMLRAPPGFQVHRRALPDALFQS